MKKAKWFFSVVLMMAMIAGTQIMIEASSYKNQIVSLPNASGVYTYKSVTRTTDYSYIEVKLNAVYPTNGGTDSYKYVYAGIFSVTNPNQQLSKTIPALNETSSTATKIYIKEGYLSQKSVYVGFKSYYTSVQLTAVVDYDGK